jgi:hypothetical protein
MRLQQLSDNERNVSKFSIFYYFNKFILKMEKRPLSTKRVNLLRKIKVLSGDAPRIMRTKT